MKGLPLKFRNLPGRKYVTGHDTFVRHRLIAELSWRFNPSTILDVGGEGALKLFMPGVKITSANIKEADICYPGGKLPLDDESFDVVVSLDTIEHLPKEMREDVLDDLYRVSRKGIIVCAPLGTREHLEHEKGILDSGMIDESSLAYLREHGRFGLPLPEEVSEIAKVFGGEIFYEGDFRQVRNSWSRHMVYGRLFIQTLRNMFSDIFWEDSKHFKSESTPYTNRFFLVAKKTDDEH